MPGDPLQELRAEIDAVDDRLLELLNNRAGLAIGLGRLKAETQPQTAGQRLRDREAAVLDRLSRANKGPLPGPALTRIFDEIFRACLDIQSGEGA